jgi:hypothetical protein
VSELSLPPAGSNSSYMAEILVGEQLVKAAPINSSGGLGQILIFRGLRVRMGMASGAEVRGRHPLAPT